jgi:hypothetical protein
MFLGTLPNFRNTVVKELFWRRILMCAKAKILMEEKGQT